MLVFTVWPIALLLLTRAYYEDEEFRPYFRVFVSVYIYAILIISINYAVIVGGAKTGG